MPVISCDYRREAPGERRKINNTYTAGGWTLLEEVLTTILRPLEPPRYGIISMIHVVYNMTFEWIKQKHATKTITKILYSYKYAATRGHRRHSKVTQNKI